MFSPSVLESVVREAVQREPLRSAWEIQVRVFDDFDASAFKIQLRALKRGVYGAELRRQMRTAETSIGTYELNGLGCRGEDQIVGYVRREVRTLLSRLFPRPLPIFRIGTRHHAKRLQPRPS